MSRFNLNYEAYFKRLIVLGWVALAVCFALKLFGQDLFTIVLQEGTLKEVCAYVDMHLWADYLVSVLYSLVFMKLFILAIAQRKSLKNWERVIYYITVFAGAGFKIWSYEWGFIYDIWQAILFPLILVLREPKKILNILYANVAVIIFQIISMYIKDTAGLEMHDNILLVTIFSIDVLIMLILYYAYANLKNIKGGSTNV